MKQKSEWSTLVGVVVLGEALPMRNSTRVCHDHLIDLFPCRFMVSLRLIVLCKGVEMC
jgi:hypothetical protein